MPMVLFHDSYRVIKIKNRLIYLPKLCERDYFFMNNIKHPEYVQMVKRLSSRNKISNLLRW